MYVFYHLTSVCVVLLNSQFVEESPFLSRDLLESCFPYALLRDAYNSVYRKPLVYTYIHPNHTAVYKATGTQRM